ATAEVADAAVTKAKLSATGGTDGQVLKLASGALSWAGDGMYLPFSGSSAGATAPFTGTFTSGLAVSTAILNGTAGIWGSGSCTGVLGATADGVPPGGINCAGLFGYSGAVHGVFGETSGALYWGVMGRNNPMNTSGALGGDSGVLGWAWDRTGVQGTSQTKLGVLGREGTGAATAPPTAAGIWGDGTSGPGVIGTSLGGHGVEGHGSGPGYGVVGSGPNTGVYGDGGSQGVWGDSASGTGVFGQSSSGTGVVGSCTSGSCSGVHGSSPAGEGVRGSSTDGYGVHGVSTNGDGVFGEASAALKSAFYGINANPAGYAGYFSGNVHVNGTLSKSGGSFTIDHPLDPANKVLSHSFVESPDMMNIYNGNVTTDEDGRAVVELPEWFEALNRDFRYQLTVIGRFAQAIIEEEIAGNRFAIRTNMANVKVSWQVTGIRKDPWAESHRIVVEQDKRPEERGFYLSPEVWGQPLEASAEVARRPTQSVSAPTSRR
ncbi:MAG: hypothetical protein ACOY3Y_20730, partial [Acidobacteriota bacterium]